jgi:hypothetical protein
MVLPIAAKAGLTHWVSARLLEKTPVTREGMASQFAEKIIVCHLEHSERSAFREMARKKQIPLSGDPVRNAK